MTVFLKVAAATNVACLEHNDLTALPDRLRTMTELAALDISWNKLEGVDAGHLGALGAVLVVNASFNQLTAWPEGEWCAFFSFSFVRAPTTCCRCCCCCDLYFLQAMNAWMFHTCLCWCNRSLDCIQQTTLLPPRTRGD